jgi:phosphatidylserine/phosphatidylglycerophosphate/cardiolipin synthase-like enzyme
MIDLEQPGVAINTPERTVADAINGHLAHLRRTWKEPPDLAIATAYFNVGGYQLLADELERVGSVRLLLGVEPDIEPRLRSLRDEPEPIRAGRERLRRALEGLERSLELARDLLGFDLEADASARRLVAWLRSGRVEVRRLEDRFLHGKAYIVTTHDEGVIAGSSNLTYAGLATNVELNLALLVAERVLVPDDLPTAELLGRRSRSSS